MKSLPVNEAIRAPSVLLIDDHGSSLGITSLDQALWLAWEADLDLVVVGPNATPPVAKILDYGKHQYEAAKAGSKGRTRTSEVKEIRLTLKIGQHDFDVKTGQASRWLAEGNRVRVTVKLIGREQQFPGRANDLIERVRTTLGTEYETPVVRMGNRWSTILGRKKNP